MVCRNSYQTHLQEVNLMQIMVNHVRVKHLKLFVQAFEWESRALTITWLGPWLMCEVALSFESLALLS